MIEKRFDLNRVRSGFLILLGISMATFWSTGDAQAHRTQGPIQGFRDQYSGKPIIEESIETGLYSLYFCAFDMGHEVHMISYATLKSTGGLYQDMVRLELHGPDGASLTVYNDHATSVLDEPVRWEYAATGTYDVTVGLVPLKKGGLGRTSEQFSMNLNHEGPTSTILGLAGGIVVVALVAVIILKKRRGNTSSSPAESSG